MDQRKDQIIIAARNLFSRQGYSKTSVDDISQAVGMTKSSLYYYFKSKEEMFMEAFSAEWEEIISRIIDKAQKADDPYQKIVAFTKESLKHYEQVVIDHKIPVRILIETKDMFRDFLNKINHKRERFFSETIREGVKIGQFCNCDIDNVAHAIMQVKFSIQYDLFSQFLNNYPTKKDFKKVEKEVVFAVELMLKGILQKKYSNV